MATKSRAKYSLIRYVGEPYSTIIKSMKLKKPMEVGVQNVTVFDGKNFHCEVIAADNDMQVLQRIEHEYWAERNEDSSGTEEAHQDTSIPPTTIAAVPVTGGEASAPDTSAPEPTAVPRSTASARRGGPKTHVEKQKARVLARCPSAGIKIPSQPAQPEDRVLVNAEVAQVDSSTSESDGGDEPPSKRRRVEKNDEMMQMLTNILEECKKLGLRQDHLEKLVRDSSQLSTATDHCAGCSCDRSLHDLDRNRDTVGHVLATPGTQGDGEISQTPVPVGASTPTTHGSTSGSTPRRPLDFTGVSLVMNDTRLDTLKKKAKSMKNFAVCLARDLFTKEEMARSNCSGRLGSLEGAKERLEETRLESIKTTTMRLYGVLQPLQDSAWKECTDAINEACRRKPKRKAQENTL